MAACRGSAVIPYEIDGSPLPLRLIGRICVHPQVGVKQATDCGWLLRDQISNRHYWLHCQREPHGLDQHEQRIASRCPITGDASPAI